MMAIMGPSGKANAYISRCCVENDVNSNSEVTIRFLSYLKKALLATFLMQATVFVSYS